MENFSTFSFLGNIAKANENYDILERKNDFLGYKTNKFKTPKIEIFPKGLVHGFGQKLHIFKLFFLFNIAKGNGFYVILERKNNFLGYKINKFKESKN